MFIFAIHLNFVFTNVFYTTRLTKQDLSYIYFEEFLNQELWVCELMGRIMSDDNSRSKRYT
jgi:hypothetical protein